MSQGPKRRPAVFRGLLALAAAVAAGGALWWAIGALRDRETQEALAALRPVASSVPPDQRERREALEIADRLLRDYPDSPEALFARGVLLFRFGFNDEAVKTWKACLKLVPDLAQAYEFLGLDAFQRGDNEQAVELLRKAVELDPQSAAAGLYLGEALNNLGRMNEAIPVLEEFLKISPHAAEPYFQLGQAYMYLKSYDRAKEYHEAALRADPGFVQALFGLAAACERLGEVEAARRHREKYAAMIARHRMAEQKRTREGHDPATVRESLANAYAMAAKVAAAHGQIREAREYWQKASAIDPEAANPDAAPAGAKRSGRAPARHDR